MNENLLKEAIRRGYVKKHTCIHCGLRDYCVDIPVQSIESKKKRNALFNILVEHALKRE